MTPQVTFRCIGCQKLVTAAQEDTGEYVLLHEMPVCKKFQDTEALDFITEARKTYSPN